MGGAGASLAFGGLSIEPPLLLAPMAGLSHSGLRRLLAELGGVGLFCTEMLSARSVPHENPQRSPYLIRSPVETPLAYQLLLADVAEVAPAVAALHALGADAVDINCGCPAPLVRRRGGGSRLMQDPARARAIVREVRRRTHLPLSAKIRLGERLDEAPLLEFARMLEAEGVELLTVHARLRAEPYGRPPRWPWVGRVKRALAIPVVANGGIFSLADARRCMQESGCDGLMVGRGGVVRPDLFAEIGEQVYGLPRRSAVPGRPEVFRRFVAHLEAVFPPERRLGRLKEFVAYFNQTYAFGHLLRCEVQNAPTLSVACARAEAFFARHDAQAATAEES